MFNLKKLCSRKIGFCCEQDWILLAAKSIVAVQGGGWFACGIVVYFWLLMLFDLGLT